VRHVGRGLLEFCRFRDSYGAVVRVQTSSSAMKPHAWVFIVGGGTTGDRRVNDGAAHLTRAHAKRLRAALDKWLRLSAPPARGQGGGG